MTPSQETFQRLLRQREEAAWREFKAVDDGSFDRAIDEMSAPRVETQQTSLVLQRRIEMVTHIDCSTRNNSIEPLCRTARGGDSFIFHPAEELRDFTFLECLTCATCKAIVEKVQAGKVLSYAKAEAHRQRWSAGQ
jgi:hypothetical protein